MVKISWSGVEFCLVGIKTQSRDSWRCSVVDGALRPLLTLQRVHCLPLWAGSTSPLPSAGLGHVTWFGEDMT